MSSLARRIQRKAARVRAKFKPVADPGLTPRSPFKTKRPKNKAATPATVNEYK